MTEDFRQTTSWHEQENSFSWDDPGGTWNMIHLLLSHSVMSDFLWPHGLQPTRLLCPWDFPGKNTGVGCHSLLQGSFDPGLKPASPAWQAYSLPLRHLRNPGSTWCCPNASYGPMDKGWEGGHGGQHCWYKVCSKKITGEPNPMLSEKKAVLPYFVVF